MKQKTMKQKSKWSRHNPASIDERLALRKHYRQFRAAVQDNARLQEMMTDPLLWLQKYTRTRDSHWREAGADSPYRPFPDKPYFRPIVEIFQKEPVLFIEKSRDMMVSWLGVGLFTHAAIIGIPGGGDQIRSYHPWGLFQDEAAFMPEAGDAYDKAVPVCKKILVVSSAGPGWFADLVTSAT